MYRTRSFRRFISSLTNASVLMLFFLVQSDDAYGGKIKDLLSAGCGDGKCRFFERRSGECPQDCGDPNTNDSDNASPETSQPTESSTSSKTLPSGGSEKYTLRPDDLNCELTDIELLFPSSGGFSFSPTQSDLVVYTRPDEDGIHQIYRKRLSSEKEFCLTCKDFENGPEQRLHKGAVDFHPDGQHLILQVEMDSHPYEGLLGAPGSGWFNNLWMTTIDGDRWWQLTDYPNNDGDSYGVLLPHVSPNGKKVAWSQLYESDPRGQDAYRKGKLLPNSDAFGRWQLNIANLEFDSSGPRLSNIKSQRPGNGNFYETQGWSANSKNLLFSADIKRDHVMKLDLWSMDVTTRSLTQLTDTDRHWEEFGSYSPDGRKIAYMSSACCDWDANDEDSIPFGKTLQTEIFLMNSDGSKKTLLTTLNENGLPGSKLEKYLKGRKVFTKNVWRKDGRALYSEMVFYARTGRPLGSGIWQLSFKGPCGDQ